MAVEGAAKVIKYIMVFFNTLFVILGIGVLAMGIYAREKKGEFDSYAVVMDNASTSSWSSFSSLCIAVGVLVILLGGSGCIGAGKENRCLLRTFAAFVALIVVLEFAAAGVGYHYSGTLKKDLQEKLYKTLHMANTTILDPDKQYINAWNDVQKEQKCCGVQSPSDWSSQPGGTPTSCEDYKKGCYEKIKDKLGKWTTWAGAALGIAFIQILAIIFALILAHRIGKKDSYTVV